MAEVSSLTKDRRQGAFGTRAPCVRVARVWSEADDLVIGGDLTAALAYVTRRAAPS